MRLCHCHIAACNLAVLIPIECCYVCIIATAAALRAHETLMSVSNTPHTSDCTIRTHTHERTNTLEPEKLCTSRCHGFRDDEFGIQLTQNQEVIYFRLHENAVCLPNTIAMQSSAFPFYVIPPLFSFNEFVHAPSARSSVHLTPRRKL